MKPAAGLEECGVADSVDPQALVSGRGPYAQLAPRVHDYVARYRTETLAQTTSPAAPGTPATTDGGTPWLWIIIGLAIIAGLVWYFRYKAVTNRELPTRLTPRPVLGCLRPGVLLRRHPFHSRGAGN